MQPSSKTLYLRATGLMGIEAVCHEQGLDVAEEFEAVGIDPTSLTDFTQLISLHAFNNLMLRLSDKTGLECIGLDLALRAPHNLNNMGPLAIVLKLGDTTGECVESDAYGPWYRLSS